MTFRRRTGLFLPIAAVALALLALPAFATEVAAQLPDPDGKPADQSQPLKVYILAGQSNMQGHAHMKTLPHMAEDPKTKPLHDKFVDAQGKARVYDQVRVVAFSEMDAWGNPKPEQTEKSGPLSISFGSHLKDPNKFGPELGFGITMYENLNQPILIIKTSWGGKSLIKDYRPPSAPKLDSILNEEEKTKARERHEAWLAKYGETYVKKFKLNGLNELKELRRTAEGRYYRWMVEHVKEVSADPGKYHPAYDKAAGFEIAGFVWFQGFNDLVSGNNYQAWGGHAAYGKWLACLIRDLRKDLSSPDIPVVIGVMGVNGRLENIEDEQQLERMIAFRQTMATPAVMPEFKGRVVAVQTSEFWPVDLDAASKKVAPLKKQANREKQEKQKNDPNIKPQVLNARQKRVQELMKENLTDEEQHLLEVGVSNWSRHYFGNAKCIGQMGEAFAKALLEIE